MNNETVSIRAANGLYLVGIVLLLSLGVVFQVGALYPGLIATELLCILLPALLLILIKRLPVKQALRLRWPGWKAAGLALLLGFGVWPLAAFIETGMSHILGYHVPMPPDALPRTVSQAIVAFLALAISAPIAEEVFFRGVIQRAYEARFGKWTGILIPALLFIFYHLRLQGLPALIPIAVLISWVYWRTQSLLTVILVHFGNNAFSSIVSIQGTFNPANPLPVISIWSALIGGLVVVAGVYLLNRLLPAIEPKASEKPISEPGWVARYWPLAIAFVVYLVMASAEVVVGKYPQLMAMGQKLVLVNPDWQESFSLNYQLVHKGGDPVGKANCQVSLEAEEYLLECLIEQETFEYKTAHSLWTGESYQDQLSAAWSVEDMNLTSLERVRSNAVGINQAEVSNLDSDFMLNIVENGVATGSLAIAPDALVIDEWPWRLMSLPFGPGLARQVTVVWPTQYDAKLGINTISERDEVVVVRGIDTVTVPSGTFFAWKVELGESQTAWYEMDAPHRLIKWDNNYVVFELVN